jgi:hypothetical protein
VPNTPMLVPAVMALPGLIKTKVVPNWLNSDSCKMMQPFTDGRQQNYRGNSYRDAKCCEKTAQTVGDKRGTSQREEVTFQHVCLSLRQCHDRIEPRRASCWHQTEQQAGDKCNQLRCHDCPNRSVGRQFLEDIPDNQAA